MRRLRITRAGKPGYELDEIGAIARTGFPEHLLQMLLDHRFGNTERHRHLADAAKLDDGQSNTKFRHRQIVRLADDFGQRARFRYRLADKDSRNRRVSEAGPTAIA